MGEILITGLAYIAFIHEGACQTMAHTLSSTSVS